MAGFSRPNLYRMRAFYLGYADRPQLSRKLRDNWRPLFSRSWPANWRRRDQACGYLQYLWQFRRFVYRVTAVLNTSSIMPTPQWRAEKSSELVKHLCHLLTRAKGQNGGTLPESVSIARADFGYPLFQATKLYCDANEEQFPDLTNTWSPELPDFLLDHPERCAESLGIVADEDYRDPYYDRPMDAGLIPDLTAPEGYALELHHAGAVVAQSDSLRGLAVKLSEQGLAPEVYLAVRNSLLNVVQLPDTGESVEVYPGWQIRIVFPAP
jgi:hypothetical protein